MKIASIAALAAALAAGIAFAGVGRPTAAHSSPAPSGRTITVSGTATARTVPDTARFTFGVDSDGATAQAATAANGQQMQRVIDALRRLGVARDDLQTQDVSVYPRRNDSGTLVGYSASSSLSVTVRELAKAGRAVDAAVAAGADETSGPAFDRTSKTELTQRALREAFADARAKAQALAQEAGARLGDVQRIEENGAAPQPEPYFRAMALKASGTPVEPGTQELQETVTVTFSLA